MTEGDYLSSFLHDRQHMIDETNQEEFQAPINRAHDCARCSPSLVSDNIQVLAADNREGPLSHSLIRSTRGKLVSPHGLQSYTHSYGGIGYPLTLGDRVETIENHLGFVTKTEERNLVDRIRIIEEKILKIEENYPQIAAHTFNYGKAEEEASRRPGGRVSRATPTAAALDVEKWEDDEGRKPIVDTDRTSLRTLEELRRRMRTLRGKLKRKQ